MSIKSNENKSVNSFVNPFTIMNSLYLAFLHHIKFTKTNIDSNKHILENFKTYGEIMTFLLLSLIM